MSEASAQQQAIEAEVMQTRAQLQASVDELAHRLDPREAAKRHRSTLIAAASAAGAMLAALMLMRRRRARRSRRHAT